MNNQNSLTLNGLNLKNFALLMVGIGMILSGIYLTNHFFDLFHSSGLQSGQGLCNISEFWGCDKATLSPLGQVAGIPTSLFGLLFGVILVITSLAGKPAFEKTAKLLVIVNLIGCAILLIFSLAVLKSLCPVCTIYYVLSALACFIFHKFSVFKPSVDGKALGILAAAFIVPVIAMKVYLVNLDSKKEAIAKSGAEQFKGLKTYGDPSVESPFKLIKSTENFADAPIRISVFSDFQCPYCQAVAKQMDKIMEEYKGKINVQYMFYPLDLTCNTEMKGSLHPFACQAAYLAACDQDKFKEVHDYIFANQAKINRDNLIAWEKKFGLSGCMNNSMIQDQIQQTLNAGKQYNLKSTPTIIVNGKKLEGLINTPILKGILDSLLEK